MSQFLNANNATTTLAGSISNTATSANLAAGSGALFPSPGAGQYFVGTFTDAATGLLHEIVWVTSITGDTITMTRGQEGTEALAWSANDLFGQLWTAGQAQALTQSGQLQAQAPNYAVDTGVANAYVCALTPALTSYTAGMPIRVLVGNANNAASTLNAGPGVRSIVRRDGSALIGGELPAGYVATFITTATALMLEGVAPATAAAITAGTDTQSAVTPAQLASAIAGVQQQGVVGSASGLVGSAVGGTKTASWTANELIVETALGGTSYKGASLTLNFNGVSVGAGGMDQSASFPTSGDLFVYAIYNPGSNTWNTLGTTASSGPVYTGGHMPSGYTASALIWAGKTDSTPNIVAFIQVARGIVVASTSVSVSAEASLTEVSLAGAIPANAKTVSGMLSCGTVSGGSQPIVASNASGLGQQYGGTTAAYVQNVTLVCPINNLPINPSTAQNIWYSTENASAPSPTLDITGYSI